MTRAGHVYTPQQTKSDEAIVRQFAALEMRKRKLKPLIGALSLTIGIFRRTPISWSKKRAEAAGWITGKPDADNSAKLIMDALNGITWGDDAQIARLLVERVYDNQRGECVIVSIRELVWP